MFKNDHFYVSSFVEEALIGKSENQTLFLPQRRKERKGLILNKNPNLLGGNTREEYG